MNNDMLIEYMAEIMADYEKHGKEKPTMEWFSEAIKRHIIDVTDKDAKIIESKLIKGIMAYREEKEKLKQKGIPKIEQADIREEIDLMVSYTVDDLDKAVKAQ